MCCDGLCEWRVAVHDAISFMNKKPRKILFMFHCKHNAIVCVFVNDVNILFDICDLLMCVDYMTQMSI